MILNLKVNPQIRQNPNLRIYFHYPFSFSLYFFNISFQAFIDMAGNHVFCLLYVFEYAAGFSNRTESQKHTFDMERSVYVIAVSS